MPKKRHTGEENVAKLRQIDVLTTQGRPVAEAVREGRPGTIVIVGLPARCEARATSAGSAVSRRPAEAEPPSVSLCPGCAGSCRRSPPPAARP
jgi:hypothetical protein